MDKTIRKTQFISAVMGNAFARKPKTNKELAEELGITEQYFYKLKKTHAKTIDEVNNKLLANMRLYAIGAITKKLAIPIVENETFALAFNISGDLKKGNTQIQINDPNKTDGETVIINVAEIHEPKKLEQIVENCLQEFRRSNTEKRKKKS